MKSRATMYPLIILCILCIVIGWWLWNRRAAAAEFESLFELSGQTRIKSISFAGQKRLVEIYDPQTLALLQIAFRSSSLGELQLGVTYEARFRFESGRSFKTGIYVHDDAGGLTIAKPTFTRIGDPMMITIRLQPPIDTKLQRLLDQLSL